MDALEGIRVLDLTWGVAGPAGILLLAEHGADVIKVEPPGGDPYRGYDGYRAWNRSRRSVALDLKSPEGKEQFLQLAGTADVIAESFAPGVMARLGLDYESLAERFPQLIYLSIPAYPTGSRNEGRPGWDALVQARSGQQYEQHAFREGPAFLASPLPSAGAMYLVPIGILAALHAREKTGRGQWVETSLYQGVLAFTTMLWVWAEHGLNDLQAMMTKKYPGSGHQAEAIMTADGWIQTPPVTQKKGATLHQVVGLEPPPDYDSYNRGRVQKLRPAPFDFKPFVEAFKTWKRTDLLDRLHEDLFQAEAILPTRDTLKHPQIVFNEMAVPVEDPEVGPTTQVGIPCKLSLTPGKVKGPRPAPGEHNAEVFAEQRAPKAMSIAGGAGQPHRYALEGIRVLDFGRAFAGPFAPMVLGGLGADVIRVTEEAGPGTDRLGDSSVYMGGQQGKRGVSVNLKDPEGLKIVYDLVATADVVHHNMTKGVPERLGIDYETLKKIKPDLIYCNTFMYGPEGPLSHLGGQDSLAQAASGLEWQAGPADEGNQPLWYRFGHADSANALASVTGIMLALAHRDRTGEGQYVWGSLLNAATYLCSDTYVTADGTASRLPKLDKNQTGFGPMYRLYETQNGWIQVAGAKAEHWAGFCEAVERPDLQTDERFATAEARVRNRRELEALLEPIFCTQTALQWRRRLDAAGVPAEVAVDTIDGESVLFNDENLGLGLVVEYKHPQFGRMRQAGPLVRFSETPGRVAGPPPIPGQHTTEVLKELGYDGGTITSLLERGVIRQPEIPGRG